MIFHSLYFKADALMHLFCYLVKWKIPTIFFKIDFCTPLKEPLELPISISSNQTATPHLMLPMWRTETLIVTLSTCGDIRSHPWLKSLTLDPRSTLSIPDMRLRHERLTGIKTTDWSYVFSDFLGWYLFSHPCQTTCIKVSDYFLSSMKRFSFAEV